MQTERFCFGDHAGIGLALVIVSYKLDNALLHYSTKNLTAQQKPIVGNLNGRCSWICLGPGWGQLTYLTYLIVCVSTRTQQITYTTYTTRVSGQNPYAKVVLKMAGLHPFTTEGHNKTILAPEVGTKCGLKMSTKGREGNHHEESFDVPFWSLLSQNKNSQIYILSLFSAGISPAHS